MKKSSSKVLSTVDRFIEGSIVNDLNIIWFRRCVYLLLLLKMIFVLPELSMFYRHTYSMGVGSMMPYKLMFLPQLNRYHLVFWVLECSLVAFSLFFRASRWLSFCVFIVGLNYSVLIDRSVNSGENLMNFLLFMLIFVREGAAANSLRQMINNAALLIIKLHFCLLYLLNALGKIMVSAWRDGSFFNDLWQLSYYANSKLIPQWFFNPTVSLIMAWAVISFELLFPCLIWYRSFNRPLVLAGIILHLIIALLLSMPDFGLTMAVVYILFFYTTPKRQVGHDCHILK